MCRRFTGSVCALSWLLFGNAAIAVVAVGHGRVDGVTCAAAVLGVVLSAFMRRCYPVAYLPPMLRQPWLDEGAIACRITADSGASDPVR